MREQHETGPPPRWALTGRAAALAAFDRGDDHADAARLTGETSPPAEASRSMGSGADGAVATSLRFEHQDLSIDIQVHSCGRMRSVSGLVTGGFDHAVLHVRRPGSTDSPLIGEDGRFTLPGLARGPISLSLRRTGHPPVVTGWFTI